MTFVMGVQVGGNTDRDFEERTDEQFDANWLRAPRQ